MAFNKPKEINFLTILVTSSLIVTPVTATANIDCRGKAFHCVNSTHFKICVDFGGVSKTVDDFLLPCPQSTECNDSNYFECEYQIITSPTTTSEQNDFTNESFQITTTTLWDNFNVTTRNNNEGRINLSGTTSISRLVSLPPVTEKLERITDTSANKHQDVILDGGVILYNGTFNKTREIENNFKPSTTTSEGNTSTYNKLTNNTLPADVDYEIYANTEKIEGIISNFFTPLETVTLASTKYSERLLSKSGANISSNNIQTYAPEENNLSSFVIIVTPSTIGAFPDTLSETSHFTSSDTYIENMGTRDVSLTVTSTTNVQDLSVSNTNIFENSTDRITLNALSENLMTTTVTNNETMLSSATVNMPLTYVENELITLKKDHLSLPVITDTSPTTNTIEDSSNKSHLFSFIDSNTEYMQYDTKFGEVNRPDILTTSNEFYTKSPEIAVNNLKKNETLSAAFNETLIMQSATYKDNKPSVTTANIEKGFTILYNKFSPASTDTVPSIDAATEIPSYISNSSDIIHSYTDVIHQDPKFGDINLPNTLTTDVHEFHAEKDVNKKDHDLAIFEKSTRKNTIDVTTSFTLIENLISTLANDKIPLSTAVDISVKKILNESIILKKNNSSLSVVSEDFTSNNFVTDAPLDISNKTSITDSYTENIYNISQNLKVMDVNISTTPTTHVYDFFTNTSEGTAYNVTQDLLFNKDGIDVVSSTSTNVTRTTISENKLLVTKPLKENLNNTVKNSSLYGNNDSSMMTKSYPITDIIMDTLSYRLNFTNTTESHVPNVVENHKMDLTINEHDSYNTTESVTIPSTTINFLENKVTESSMNLHDPSITNALDIVHAEQNINGNTYASLKQEIHNDVLFSTTPLYGTLNNIHNALQKNENDSELITTSFGFSSNTIRTVDDEQSTEHKVFPTMWNILNITVLDLLTSRNYLLKNNANDKYTGTNLESKRTNETIFSDNINRNDSHITDIQASTSVVEVETLPTSVAFGNLSTDIVQTTSKNMLHTLMPYLSNNFNDIYIDRGFSSNVSLAEVENVPPYLTVQSIKTTDITNIFTNNFDLSVSTEKVADKLTEPIKHLVGKSNLSQSLEKTSIVRTEETLLNNLFINKNIPERSVLKPANSDLNGSYFQLPENSMATGTEQKSAIEANTIAPTDVTITDMVFGISEINGTKLKSYELNSVQSLINSDKIIIKNIDNNSSNSDALKNKSLIFLKNMHQDSLTVPIKDNINKNMTDYKVYTDDVISQDFNVHNGNTSLNKTSQHNNLSLDINTIPIFDYSKLKPLKNKDLQENSNTKVESDSTFSISPNSQSISDNKDSFNNTIYLANTNERAQNYISNLNDTKLSTESYANPGNEIKNYLMPIPEVNNTSNSSMINKCRDNNTRKGCIKNGEDFTNLSEIDKNISKSFERSQSIVINCDNQRGKYSDKNDCKSFYICFGKSEPMFGKCPNNTVFSEILKQCTKNLSHCVRNNEFQCISPGRYIDVSSNQFYYICAKKRHGYIRFKLQCQKGYHLNNSEVKCVLDSNNGSSSDEDSSYIDENRKTIVNENKEDVNLENNKNTFECVKEGKFTYPDHCRKFYECKRVKSEFRRKIKKCDSKEVFDEDEEKCVDDDSYECKQ